MADEQLYIVRLWDGFDGEWMDIGEPMPKFDAEQLAGDKNFAKLGKRDAGYGDIDYYKAFPSDTVMHFDGSSPERTQR